MKTMILLGAPGAGKGTVAQAVCERGGFEHVSTGDMLREAIKAGTPVGLEAKSYMDKGALVPDATILKLVEQRILKAGTDGRILLDGFPRTENQACMLDELLAGCGGELTAVILLEVSDAVLIERLAGRRLCRQCGAVYHVKNIPPRKEDICDLCGGALYQRPDDNEATVRHRLEVYRDETSGLIDYYERRGVLRRVDGTQERTRIGSQVEGYMA